MKLSSKLFIFFAVIIILGVMIWFYFLDSTSTDNNQIDSFDTNQTSSQSRPVDQVIAAQQQVQSSTSVIIVADDSEKLLPKKSAWALNNNIQPAMPLPPGISIYEAVELPDQNIYPQIGEQLSLPLPQADAVTVIIESSESHTNGDYTWRGHLTGHGNEYPVVTTYGKHSTFSTITTPQGSYTLELINNQGWLYKNPSVHELSAPGHEDGLEIP